MLKHAHCSANSALRHTAVYEYRFESTQKISSDPIQHGIQLNLHVICVMWCGAVLLLLCTICHRIIPNSNPIQIYIYGVLYIYSNAVSTFIISQYFFACFFLIASGRHTVLCVHTRSLKLNIGRGDGFFFHAILFLFLKPRNAHFSSSAFYLSTFEMGLLFIFVVAARTKKKSLHGPSAAYRCRWQPVCAVRLMREIQFRYCMIAHSTVSYDISSSVASLFSQISCTCLK